MKNILDLYMAVGAGNKDAIDEKDVLPEKAEEYVNLAFESVLTPREADLMRLRINGATQREIAEDFDISVTRVGQVESKCIRKLKTPTALGILNNGYGPKKLVIDELIRGDSSIDILLEVEDPKLSVRSYNALRRSGIDTVSQLMGMSFNDMMNSRNFGLTSLKNVCDVISGHVDHPWFAWDNA